MQPIQFKCGGCGQVMGISPEHLGTQVQCPHCKVIVQTPAPAAAPPALASSALGGAFAPSAPAGRDQESIFGQPEPTDDLFGHEEPAPRIEMPPEPTLEPPPQPEQPADEIASAPTLNMTPASAPVAAHEPPSFLETASAPEDLTSFAPMHRVAERGMFATIMMIFLVPYAICMTAFTGYLIYTWPRDNPLRMLPDAVPKGQPRKQFQVKHDWPLDKDMKTSLGQPIRVGAIEVTPLSVRNSGDGDLVLMMKAKNVSPDLTFAPVSDEYLKFSKKTMDSGRPYTFLDRIGGANTKKLYGGYLEQFKGRPGKETPYDEGDIGPGEEVLIQLTSLDDYRAEVPKVLTAPERLLWRVQLRRGLVPVDGKMVSATTVIGVEFSARDIVKDPDL